MISCFEPENRAPKRPIWLEIVLLVVLVAENVAPLAKGAQDLVVKCLKSAAPKPLEMPEDFGG